MVVSKYINIANTYIYNVNFNDDTILSSSKIIKVIRCI